MLFAWQSKGIERGVEEGKYIAILRDQFAYVQLPVRRRWSVW